MRVVSYSNFRQNLKESIRRVREDSDALLVTNKDPEDNIVVLNEADYSAMMETMRIYANPALHAKILAGLDEVDRGRYSEHELDRDE
jgi:antitoxin YefM